jgi:hypothetical protein
MNWQNVWQLIKSDYLKLVPILGLASYMAFIPHINYPYLVHIDEWVHLAHMKALLQANSTAFIEPFFGQETLGISQNLEAGFHLFWSVFQSISGLSWLTIFRYFPSIIYVITVFSVYVLAQREGFGWEAALFASLIPTTVGILGPAFLVPVALGLLFLPLSLFLVFNFKSVWSYLTLFLFICFLLSMHATTAVGLIIILVPFILLNLKGNFKHSLGITIASALPFLVLFPWIFNMVLSQAQALLSPWFHPAFVQIPVVMRDYGYLPVAFCLLGTFLLVIRGDKKSYSLVLGLVVMLLVLVTYYTFHYGMQPLYTRGLMYMMLMMSVVAGAGLNGIRKLKIPEKISRQLRVPSLVTQNMGAILCFVLVGIVLAQAIPSHQRIPYYHMIDGQDYEVFVWIRDNVAEKYDRAILDPWKATAFTAVTRKHVYTRIHEFAKPSDEEAYEFLSGNCTDTAFLHENGISIVYTGDECKNPSLIKVRQNVYLLEE